MKQPDHLPAGTPVTVELRTGEHKTEFVDATVIGYDDSGERVQIVTFDRKHYVVDAQCVTPDPVEAVEEIDTPLVEVLQHTAWPEFPRVKPTSIR